MSWGKYTKYPSEWEEGSKKEQALNQLRANPMFYDYSSFPQELKNDPEILRQRMKGWDYRLSLRSGLEAPSIYYTDEFPQDLKNDPEILKLVKNTWLIRASRDPNTVQDPNFPQDLKNSQELVDRQREGELENVESYPWKYDSPDFPQKLKNDPEIIERRRIGWMSELWRDPAHFDKDYFPQDLKKDADFVQKFQEQYNNVKNSFIRAIKNSKDPMDVYNNNNFSEYYKTDPDVLNIINQGAE